MANIKRKVVPLLVEPKSTKRQGGADSPFAAFKQFNSLLRDFSTGIRNLKSLKEPSFAAKTGQLPTSSISSTLRKSTPYKYTSPDARVAGAPMSQPATRSTSPGLSVAGKPAARVSTPVVNKGKATLLPTPGITPKGNPALKEILPSLSFLGLRAKEMPTPRMGTAQGRAPGNSMDREAVAALTAKGAPRPAAAETLSRIVRAEELARTGKVKASPELLSLASAVRGAPNRERLREIADADHNRISKILEHATSGQVGKLNTTESSKYSQSQSMAVAGHRQSVGANAATTGSGSPAAGATHLIHVEGGPKPSFKQKLSADGARTRIADMNAGNESPHLMWWSQSLQKDRIMKQGQPSEGSGSTPGPMTAMGSVGPSGGSESSTRQDSASPVGIPTMSRSAGPVLPAAATKTPQASAGGGLTAEIGKAVAEQSKSAAGGGSSKGGRQTLKGTLTLKGVNGQPMGRADLEASS